MRPPARGSTRSTPTRKANLRGVRDPRAVQPLLRVPQQAGDGPHGRGLAGAVRPRARRNAHRRALAAKLFKKRSPMFIQKHYNEMFPLISLVEDRAKS